MATRHDYLRAPPAARIGGHVPFDARNVEDAPAQPGVYLLYRGRRLIYIGLAASGGVLPACNRLDDR